MPYDPVPQSDFPSPTPTDSPNQFSSDSPQIPSPPLDHSLLSASSQLPNPPSFNQPRHNNLHIRHSAATSTYSTPDLDQSTTESTADDSTSRSPTLPGSSNLRRLSSYHDSHPDNYGPSASAVGPDISSLSAIVTGLVGGDYGPFPAQLTTVGMGSISSRLSQSSPPQQSPPHPRWSPDQKRLTSLTTTVTGSDCPEYYPNPSIGLRAAKQPLRPSSQDGSQRDSFVSFDDSQSVPYAYGAFGRGPNSQAPHSGIGYGFGETTDELLWKDENKEPDDFLHDPDPALDSLADRRIIFWSGRGWMNVASLAILIGGLIALFALYPIITYVIRQAPGIIGWNLGGINGTGQVPDIPGLPGLIDATTPDNAKSRTGFDGEKYNLVFSDEFNTDGRTFWPGDDPFWEAVDLHYWFVFFFTPRVFTHRPPKFEAHYRR